MYKGYKDLSGKYWSDVKYGAKRRGIPFSKDLTIEYAWELFIKQEKKCVLSGLNIELYPDIKTRNTASLDRIDNSKGYSRCNIQWLHKSVNVLKHKMTNEETIELCRKIFLRDLYCNRRDWPEYFINMAYIIASRSRDKSTKHGCVITKDWKTVSTGYNGSFQGIDDSLVPETRPEKYDYYCHAEESALIYAKQDLTGCYAFITGLPCKNCCKLLIHSGITKIYYGNTMAKMCENGEEIVRNLCKIKNVELIKIDI